MIKGSIKSNAIAFFLGDSGWVLDQSERSH